MTKVFIDGSAGTTGLRIRERLSARKDIELVILPEETRKDPAARAEALNSAAVSFLCLPDAAAIEAASFVTSPDAVIIDTSTAHRVAEGWTYGMAELTGQREKLQAAKCIANPGCHATGFISLVAPLVAAGLVKKDVRLSCFSLTGYSGGGKKMIAEYEAENVDPLYQAPRQYGLGQTHKHLPEMSNLCGLDHAPVFCPIVAPYYAGMEVTVPLTPADTSASIEEIKEVYKAYFQQGLIRFADAPDEGGFLSAGAFAGRDDLQVSVYGNDERILLVSRFDNLGKGASGAAIQNMNIALGLDEAEGLVV
ncbi:MAG: N-acetyl-gamma-glutamyl-phosphate reductase [Clostridia bacterium]|nr:N-acetyl-gamma-glutamyl-phosphate reductase [Clostridia bacterium]